MGEGAISWIETDTLNTQSRIRAARSCFNCPCCGGRAACCSAGLLRVENACGGRRLRRKSRSTKPAAAGETGGKEEGGALEEQKKWTTLRAEREFSWPEVFAAVEKAGSPDIELLAFKPDKGNRTVLLGGEARDQKALLGFLDALAGQSNLKNVHLTLQQRKKRERLETVVFEIKAQIAH